MPYIVLVVVAMLGAESSAALDQASITIRIQPVEAHGLPTEIARELTDRIRALVAGSSLYTLVSRDDARLLDDELAFRLSDACTGRGCTASTVRTPGARTALTTHLGALDGNPTMTLRWLDVERRTEIRSLRRACHEGPRCLLELVPDALSELLGMDVSGSSDAGQTVARTLYRHVNESGEVTLSTSLHALPPAARLQAQRFPGPPSTPTPSLQALALGRPWLALGAVLLTALGVRVLWPLLCWLLWPLLLVITALLMALAGAHFGDSRVKAWVDRLTEFIDV